MPYPLSYPRASTTEQDPALQHDVLRAAGCAVFTDIASGARDGQAADRPSTSAPS